MFSFIILSIILILIIVKSLLYLFKSFSPLALIISIFSVILFLVVWDIRFEIVGAFSLKNHFPILATTDFYWFTSILIAFGVIILRDLHRNIYFEKLTTDLVRKLAHENAKKL